MQDEDEVMFIVENSEDMKTFVISISSPEPLTVEELSACLVTLAEDMDKSPETFFKNSIATCKDIH